MNDILMRAEQWLHLSPAQWLELIIILAPIAILLAVMTELARWLSELMLRRF